MKKLLAGLLILVCAQAYGAEVAGVKFADTVKSGAAELVLNGAGLRTRVFFKVYVAGLYLPAKKNSSAEILAGSGPKRIAIHMLRDVDAEDFSEALEKGIKDNHSEAELAGFATRIAALNAVMKQIKEAKTGMVILLDWIPGTGTRITIDNQPRGNAIPGEDFYNALLRIWLGDNPAQADLKKAMLGQGG